MCVRMRVCMCEYVLIHTHTYTCNSCTPLLVGTWEMYRPKAGYNYYVSRSIARLRVAERDFVHDIEKDDFLKELEVAINQFRWLLGRLYFPNQRASGQLFERTRKMAESTSLGIFTERTKKLIEPTSFRVFTERTKKLA